MFRILFLLFVVFSSHVWAQKKVFKGKEISYSIELDSAAAFQKMPVPTGLAEAYVLKKGSTFKFVTAVQKVEGFTEHDMIYTEDFKAGFLKTCKCEVLDVAKAQYTNIQGARFHARIPGKTQPFIGYFMMVPRGGALYQIMVLITENDPGGLEGISKEIFDSVVIEE